MGQQAVLVNALVEGTIREREEDETIQANIASLEQETKTSLVLENRPEYNIFRFHVSLAVTLGEFSATKSGKLLALRYDTRNIFG